MNIQYLRVSRPLSKLYTTNSLPLTQLRHASLTGAIEKGIRKSSRDWDSREKWQQKTPEDGGYRGPRNRSAEDSPRPRYSRDDAEFRGGAWGRDGQPERSYQQRPDGPRRDWNGGSNDRHVDNGTGRDDRIERSRFAEAPRRRFERPNRDTESSFPSRSNFAPRGRPPEFQRGASRQDVDESDSRPYRPRRDDDNNRGMRRDRIERPSNQFNARPTRPREEAEAADDRPYHAKIYVGNNERTLPNRAERRAAKFGPRSTLPREDAEPDSDDAYEAEPRPARPARPLLKSTAYSDVPASIPFTTAGSEFIYGTFTVKAALRSGRRNLYKLYIQHQENSTPDPDESRTIKMAAAAGATVRKVGQNWDSMLGRMSGGRPHNGYILEATPIPKLPVTALEVVDGGTSTFAVQVPSQSPEDAKANGWFEVESGEALISRVNKSAYPLIVMLDRIVDPGNLGAIIRACYCLGADAVAIIDHGTAPIGPVAVKASAGAAEHLPVLLVKKEIDFLKLSKANGWKVFAGMMDVRGKPQADIATETVLANHPSILIVGNEGSGVRPVLQRLADVQLTIPNARAEEDVVDSLNVSVATAILVHRFFQGPHRSVEPAEEVPSSPPEEDTIF